jgi:hypothetical protein
MLITNETMTHLIERSNEESEIDNMIYFEMRKHLMELKKKTSSQHSPPIGKAINKPTEKEGPVQESAKFFPQSFLILGVSLSKYL